MAVSDDPTYGTDHIHMLLDPIMLARTPNTGVQYPCGRLRWQAGASLSWFAAAPTPLSHHGCTLLRVLHYAHRKGVQGHVRH